MPSITNAEIVDNLYRLAVLLEIEGANEFRVRAYRNAARTISELPESAAAMVQEGEDLSELPGIGKDLAGKIATLVQTGHFQALEQEEKKLPRGLVEMTLVPGMGPKHIKQVYDSLNIDNLNDLADAAKAGKLRELPRFGQKLEAKILQAVQQHKGEPKRTLLARAEEIGEAYLSYLKEDESIQTAIIAGSYRRRKETVGDLDILATSTAPEKVLQRFVDYHDVTQVIAKGPTRSTVMLRTGIQVDLRVVPERSYGAALHYFTGSKPHNIAIRRMGEAKGLKINEYGVFKGKRCIGGRSEEEVYKSVGLPYIEPELREDRGEIDAAMHNRLPNLITLSDILGDLHIHTTDSDGHASIEEVLEIARARGYQYLAITDHTERLGVARGLDEKRRRAQLERIDALNQRLRKIKILKSAEIDIHEDGTLDLPQTILKELDFTVCSIHHKFDLPAEKQTERIFRAMDNKYFSILGHPSGRLINKRDAYPLDMEKVVRGAKARGVFLELNSQPDRLDLNDINARMAAEAGVLLSISTDAHSAQGLYFMRLGVDQARRAWIEPRHVLNTRPLSELRQLFKRGWACRGIPL